MTYELTMNGLCMGTSEAMELFETDVADAVSQSGVDTEDYERALNRVRWLANRLEPVRPKFSKGKYGHQYDSYTCGACSFVVGKTFNFCPGCGREINWKRKEGGA